MKQRTFYRMFIAVFVFAAFTFTASAQSSATKQNNAPLQSKEKSEKLEQVKSADQSGLKYQADKLASTPAYSNFRVNGQPVKAQPKPYVAKPASRVEQLELLRQKAIENGRPTDKYDIELNKLTNQN